MRTSVRDLRMPGVFSANKVIFQISISFYSIEYMYFRNSMYAIIVICMNCKFISNSHPVRPVLKIRQKISKMAIQIY